MLADGRIVSGSKDKSVRVWDPLTGACNRVLKRHTSVSEGTCFVCIHCIYCITNKLSLLYAIYIVRILRDCTVRWPHCQWFL